MIRRRGMDRHLIANTFFSLTSSTNSIYKSKVPDIQQTLDIINALMRKRDESEEMLVNYALCDTVYAKAKIEPSVGKVCLWIGASTMVEYTYEEAFELLTQQLAQTHAKIEELNEDLYHLRGNSITVEVNMARLFNHSVKLKKLASLQSTVVVGDNPLSSPEQKPK